MDETLREELIELRRQNRVTGNRLERILAFNEAVGLAYLERTGLELQPGGEFSGADRTRANEIMKLFPEPCALHYETGL